MKKLWRERLKLILSSLSAQRKSEASQRLCSIPLPQKGYILSFMSLYSEISTYDLNYKLSLEGRLLLPRIEGTTLKPCLTSSLGDLVPGPWGTLEPPSFSQTITPSIILVPGLCFDKKGYRLGYGKGYYDRFLAHHKESLSIGIGFHEQYVRILPTESHDIPLNHCFFC